MFVKMPDIGMHGIRIEVRATKDIEVFKKSGVPRGADQQILRLRNALVDAGADALPAAERACKPGSIALAHQPASKVHPEMNSALEAKRDEGVHSTGQAGRRGGAVFTSGERILELGHIARLLLCHCRARAAWPAVRRVSPTSTRSGEASVDGANGQLQCEITGNSMRERCSGS